jgi:hypothetical protein
MYKNRKTAKSRLYMKKKKRSQAKNELHVEKQEHCEISYRMKKSK